MTGRWPLLCRLPLAACWLPPAIYLLADSWVRCYEVWGTWAAAPVLLSLVFGLLGIALLAQAGGHGDRRGGLVWATLLAGAPTHWLLPRIALAELRRSLY